MLEYEDYKRDKTVGAASEFITRAIEDNAHEILNQKTYADYISASGPVRNALVVMGCSRMMASR